MPRLPNTATPNAPLNSAQVSASAEAAPARSRGAAVIIISLPMVMAGAMPRPISTVAATSVASARSPTASVTPAKPRRPQPAPRPAPSGRAAVRQPRRRQRTAEKGERPRHRREAGVQRREAEHALQVLRDEDVGAEHRQAGEAVGNDRGAEAGVAEELEVEQRMCEPALTAHEGDAHRQPEQQRRHGERFRPALGDPLQAVHGRQHGRQRLHRR